MRPAPLLARGLTALCAFLLTAVLLTQPSVATPSPLESDESKSAHVEVTLAQSGQVTVTEQHTWTMPANRAHRVVRTLPLFAPYSDELLKRFEYSNFAVSSPAAIFELKVLDTGSNVEVHLDVVEENTDLQDPLEEPEYITVSAELTYSIKGVLSSAPSSTSTSTHEFFWSALDQAAAEYDRFDVTVVAPAAALDSACELTTSVEPEPESETDPLGPCTTSQAAQTLEFSVTDLPIGGSVTTRATYPYGTFDRTDPLTVDWKDPQHDEADLETDQEVPFDPTWTQNLDPETSQSGNNLLPILVGLMLGIGALITVFLVRRRSDYRFVGTEPGAVPLHYESHSLERAPVAVTPARTTVPPAQLSVAEAGALTFGELRAREVMAMLVDLAVRGHLTITEVGPPSPAGTWQLSRTPLSHSDVKLLPGENTLLTALFQHGEQVEFASMHANYAPAALEVLRAIGQEVANKGLFRQVLEHVSTNHSHRKQRTGLGRALYEQLRGFEQFLINPTPSELDDLVATSTVTDVFSAYLPYALSFDCATQWARVCDSYAEATEAPAWFTSEVEPWNGSFENVVAQLMTLVRTGY